MTESKSFVRRVKVVPGNRDVADDGRLPVIMDSCLYPGQFPGVRKSTVGNHEKFTAEGCILTGLPDTYGH